MADAADLGEDGLVAAARVEATHHILHGPGAVLRAHLEVARAAAEALVADRLMLVEDVDRCVASADDWDRERHDLRAL